MFLCEFLHYRKFTSLLPLLKTQEIIHLWGFLLSKGLSAKRSVLLFTLILLDNLPFSITFDVNLCALRPFFLRYLIFSNLPRTRSFLTLMVVVHRIPMKYHKNFIEKIKNIIYILFSMKI